MFSCNARQSARKINNVYRLWIWEARSYKRRPSLLRTAGPYGWRQVPTGDASPSSGRRVLTNDARPYIGRPALQVTPVNLQDGVHWTGRTPSPPSLPTPPRTDGAIRRQGPGVRTGRLGTLFVGALTSLPLCWATRVPVKTHQTSYAAKAVMHAMPQVRWYFLPQSAKS